MFKNVLCRLAIGLLLLWLIPFLWHLPRAQDLLEGGITKGDRTLSEMPDYDLTAASKEYWENGQEGTAIAMLEYVIANDLPDKPAAEMQHNNYMTEIKKQKTLLGRSYKALMGGITGNVETWEGLAGSCLGDFFVYGDLRDLARELVFEDEKDEFVIVLSSIGLVTTFWPPADPAASALKAAKKSGAITKPLQKNLITAARAAKNTPKSAGKARRFVTVLSPLWDMTKKCTNWHQYKLFLRQVDNPAQARRLVKILDKKGNPKKLEQILSTANTGVKTLPKKLMRYINASGQKGMDTVYGAIRKGPKGLRFIAENPKVTARVLKNTRKAQVWGFGSVVDKWQVLMLKLGNILELIRWGAIAVLTFVIFICLVPFQLYAGIYSKLTPEKHGQKSGPTKTSYFKTTFVVCSFLILFALVIHYFSPSINASAVAASEPAKMTRDSIVSSSQVNFDVTSMSLVSVFIFSHVIAGYWATRRVRKIDELDSSPKQKLSLLSNDDIFFDLPLYIGLTGTVVSFIIITITPAGGRLVAYTSTVIGLISAAFLRVRILVPYREQLINSEESVPGENTL